MSTTEIVRDALVLVTGVVLAGSTIWLPVDGDTGASGAILVLGVLAAGTALWAMSSASRASHWSHLVLGVMLALSPVVLVFPAGVVVTDAFAVIGGLLVAAVGLAGVVSGQRGASTAGTPVAAKVDGFSAPLGVVG